MATSHESDRKPWEDLDEDLAGHVTAVSPEETTAIDDALELQMISIRLQKSLIGKLKFIAEYHKVGYQPLIRDLLNRFARSELRDILSAMVAEKNARLQQLEREIEQEKPLEVVDDFFQREHKRVACG